MNCLEMLKQFITSQNLGEENIALAMEKINRLNETNPDKVNEDYSEEILASTIIDLVLRQEKGLIKQINFKF